MRNDSSPVAIYFIGWLYVGKFVMFNLFVATIVDNFVKVKDEENAGASGSLLTNEQKQWQAAIKEARSAKCELPPAQIPDPPESELRLWAYQLVTSGTKQTLNPRPG